MSVVAEDPTMVKYLLDQGINIHEECYGNFFCPEDQKPSRSDSLDHERVDVRLLTDYKGYVYWGEYSLSFAAVLSQEECFRLILSRGANPDLVDTNGNTVTHIMVVYDNMRMFDLAVECGATINTLNNLQLTPLTVAAYLARKGKALIYSFQVRLHLGSSINYVSMTEGGGVCQMLTDAHDGEEGKYELLT